jgi:phenylacetate 2-hydroxylase
MISVQVYSFALIALTYLLIRYFNRTDTPKIKGIPEIPGYPIFGSLYELGNKHAVVAKRWAEKYGPVFQVRMGNRVCA